MRVFCPEHGKGFFAPRRNPVKCENHGHAIGELDFEGQAVTPAEARWQYCCNCEHFYLIAPGPETITRCPACARQISTRYLCNRCYTISCESNTPVKTKNFTLTAEGVPRPACPGCLQPATGDVGEHDCDSFGAPFLTALTTCPICLERLDVAPSFPATVAYYLKRSRNKLSVTFDYERELFQPADDGEFVLVRNGDQAGHELMLPRLPHFSVKRDFYDYYQDSFYCAEPSGGEVRVIEPAIVDRVENGWKLQARGILEIVGKASISKARPAKSTREAEVQEQAVANISCPHCHTLVDGKYSFCWHCGKSIKTEAVPANRSSAEVNHLEEPPFEEEEITISPEASVSPTTTPSIFAWASPQQVAPAVNNGLSIKLIAAVVVALALISLLLFVVLRGSPSTVPTASANSETNDSATQFAQTGQASEATAQTASQKAVAGPIPPDLDSKTPSEKTKDVEGSDRASELRSLSAREKQHPDDYSLPYQRAKLSIDPQESHSHHEAFAALLLAARKAIESGKADEMLASLKADKDGAFRKLSHGHAEWKQLEEALKNKNKSVLTARLNH